MSSLDLAIIGNSTYSALIDRLGRVVWGCFPRFDGDPLFCALLNGERGAVENGFFDVIVDDFSHAEQEYISNTAILKTTLFDVHGSAVEIVDFAPRFSHYERTFRPPVLIRQLKPVRGTPRVKIRLRPMHDYGAHAPERTRGSNHIRFSTPHEVYRLTTDISVSFLWDETSFLLEEPINIMFGPDEPLRASLTKTCREFYEETLHYWLEWSRALSIPFEYQEAVIRAAITLKLCAFEESGAIIAAATTSIPEAAGTERNWDYRFCWLRDAYFVVNALNLLGTTKTMENYLRYLSNIVAGSKDGHLQPVYGITMESKLIERMVDTLSGYRDNGPVRVGNQAYEHIQNDVYGSVILAAAQAFFDKRLAAPGDLTLFERLEQVGRQAVKLFDKPDAGLWEFRGIAHVHTFSAVMCWAGADRLARIAGHLNLTARKSYWRGEAERMRAEIMEKSFDAERNTFVGSWEGDELDASLLLLNKLQFIKADDPRWIGTVEAHEKELRKGNHMMRYIRTDDFGAPENAFNICTFWLIEALAAIGRREDACAIFNEMLACRNHLGLLSEDWDFNAGELWGNFPQTYSMVGLIHAAMVLSKPWEEAF